MAAVLLSCWGSLLVRAYGGDAMLDPDEPGNFFAALSALLISGLVGRLSLPEMVEWIRLSRLMVTNDTGPMHVAAALGTPVVALFGPTDPKRTGPRGAGESSVLQYVPPGYSVPFSGKNFPEGGWLSHIAPEQVFDAVERAVKK